jgi:hypothetical protein
MIVAWIEKYAIMILGGLSGVLAVACFVMWIQVGHYKNQVAQAHNEATAQVNEYERVYNQTFTAHFNAKIAEDARLAANTEKTNNATEPARAAALGVAASYRATHQCVLREPAPANINPPEHSDLPGTAANSGSSQAPGEAVELIGVTPETLNNATLNSADLQTAYEWAQGLAKAPDPTPADAAPH